MEYDSANTLMQVVCLLLAFAAVSWAIMVRPMRIAPKASLRFSIANACVLAGMLLYTQRSADVSYLYWIGADVTILLGVSCLRSGAQALYHLPSSLHIDLSIIAITALLMSLVPPSAASGAYHVCLLSVSCAVLFYGFARDHYFGFKETLTSFATYWLVVPLVLISLLFLSRAILLIVDTSHLSSIATLDASPQRPVLVLWVYIVFILVVNILAVGNSINKLVTKILSMANVDALTGVYNRNYLHHKLNKVHRQWLQHQSQYSVLLFDLDHFKQINDTYGHGIGDEVLKQTAQRISQSLYSDDFFFRFGGEEFLVLMPNTSVDQAHSLAQRCKAILNDFSVATAQGAIKVSASFGVASISQGMSSEQLLSHADKAMYQAKHAGRDCIRSAA
ncbi:GGDEF domain-containing protein [Shewanella maritima]|uniref:diguanylate cyclase n=1 Tax=Shewanella maritima TaxID=2520507 RepID=A0A411PH47_9GAMM|nr:GGDEF domain-containing protein [Shewanella maritima]QBF82926.1 GGDEF domain-containing protein [Shewanella maritima]